MTRATEIFAVIQLALMGLSHIAHHRAWAEFYIRLRERGRAGAFVQGFMNLGFGSMIVAFHRVWSGIPAVLSVLGVLYLVKAAQCLLFPDASLRGLQRMTLERSWFYVVPAGVGFVGLAVLIGYGVAR